MAVRIAMSQRYRSLRPRGSPVRRLRISEKYRSPSCAKVGGAVAAGGPPTASSPSVRCARGTNYNQLL